MHGEGLGSLVQLGSVTEGRDCTVCGTFLGAAPGLEGPKRCSKQFQLRRGKASRKVSRTERGRSGVVSGMDWFRFDAWRGVGWLRLMDDEQDLPNHTTVQYNR